MNLKKMHDEVMRLSDPMRLARKMADSFEPGDTPGTFKLPKMQPYARKYTEAEVKESYAEGFRAGMEEAAKECDHWQRLIDKGTGGCKCGLYIGTAIRGIAAIKNESTAEVPATRVVSDGIQRQE